MVQSAQQDIDGGTGGQYESKMWDNIRTHINLVVGLERESRTGTEVSKEV